MSISGELYGLILEQLNALPFEDKAGDERDTRFMADEFWLQDTAVIDHISREKGMFTVALVFAHHIIPFKCIRRPISSYADIKKATVSAHYMRRLAAKDQRGTLVVSLQRYNLNNN